jgi:chemotaxis protein CheD
MSAALDLTGALVPMGQMRLWEHGGGLLGTRALGSCVAIMLRDKAGRAAGLAHCMLPLSQIDKGVANIEPCTFADSGIATLRDAVLNAGVAPDALEALVVGGAALLGDADSMNMGKRNVQVAHMLLEQFAVQIVGECTGGQLPRSVWFDPAEGWVDVFCAGHTERLKRES